jgi:hypothetical protein
MWYRTPARCRSMRSSGTELLAIALAFAGLFAIGQADLRAEEQAATPPSANSTENSSTESRSDEDKPATTGPETNAVDSASIDPNRETLLLLTTGRIVTGHVTRNGGQYLVKKPNGEMFIPAEHVSIIARDLRDCYRQLRDKLPGKSPPDEHLSLARWCLSRQMLNEARNEALETLRIDSTRDDARQLIQKIDAILNPPVHEKPTAEEVERAKLRTVYGVNDFESLGGLTREQAKLFTSRVHPILLNNCTSSGCHGAKSTGEFKLERLPLGDAPRKQIVLRNLTAVLQQVDREAPESSLLLTAKTGPHARSGRVVFAGAKGAEQARVVREWMRMVAEGESSRPTTSERNPGLAHHESDDPFKKHDSADNSASGKRQSTSTDKSTINKGRSTGARAVDVVGPTPDNATKSRDNDLVAPPADAFSPDAFNAASPNPE